MRVGRFFDERANCHTHGNGECNSPKIEGKTTDRSEAGIDFG